VRAEEFMRARTSLRMRDCEKATRLIRWTPDWVGSEWQADHVLGRPGSKWVGRRSLMIAGKRPMIGTVRRRRGASAAELALLSPLLMIMFCGAVDFCRFFYTYTTITNAARNGAMWLADPLAATQSPYANYQQAALADANGLSPALSASNVTSSNGTDGQGNATVSVNVQYTFNLMTSYLGFSSLNLQRTIAMRTAPQTTN
jgi:Flp pilus assembly protein TadG